MSWLVKGFLRDVSLVLATRRKTAANIPSKALVQADWSNPGPLAV
jgi:hypothetical protein